MATSVLPNASSHFSAGGSEVYPPTMYQGYSNYDGFTPENQSNYLYNADQTHLGYASPDNWASQASHASNLRRVSSRSPSSQHDRTPIRHHKPGVSRSRSTSKPEALLAFATEQSAQSQQHSTATTPSLPQTTPGSSPALFPSSYTSPSLASPYQHAPYYENQNSHYQDMHGPPSSHSHGIPEFLPTNRTDMQMPSLLPAGLAQHESMYLPGSTQTRAAQIPGLQPAPHGFAPLPRPLESTPGGIEVSSSRNKPQCWDHGCNGRQFSTFSNLLRHQREKSGTAAKARCPHCGTEFTRTTARNGHMYGGKCKGMSDSGRRSSSTGEGTSDVEGQH